MRTSPPISGASASLRAVASPSAPAATAGGEPRGAARPGPLHEAAVALLLHRRRDVTRERVGGRALHRRVLEAADTVEPGLLQPREQLLELLLGLARKADDEGAAQRQLRALGAPLCDAPQRVLGVRRAAHALEDLGTAVLERYVEIGQHAPLRHERDDLVHVRIGIDIVQPHPDAERAERAREIDEARPPLLAAPLTARIA